METLTICHEKELSLAVEAMQKILDESGKKIICLNAEMGAGKTTFVSHWIKSISSINQVSSPTFSLVNDYETELGLVHHFDLYRLESLEEVEEIGFWEFIDSKQYCIIEWPQIIAELLPQELVLNVDIAVSLPQCREFTFSS